MAQDLILYTRVICKYGEYTAMGLIYWLASINMDYIIKTDQVSEGPVTGGSSLPGTLNLKVTVIALRSKITGPKFHDQAYLPLRHKLAFFASKPWTQQGSQKFQGQDHSSKVKGPKVHAQWLSSIAGEKLMHCHL